MIAALLSGALVVGVAALVGSRGRAIRTVAADGTRSQGGTAQAVGLARVDRWFRSVRRHDRPDAIRPAAIAEWVDDVARNLRHGSTLHEALSQVMPGDAAVEIGTGALRHELTRGTSVVDACGRWSDSLPATGLQRVDLLATTSTVTGAAAFLGGSAAAPLDRLAIAMRQHSSNDLERSAQSAQARLSARVLTLVPMAVLMLLVVTDDDVRHAITGAAGAAVVVVGLSLNGLGALWMRRIVGRHDSGTR